MQKKHFTDKCNVKHGKTALMYSPATGIIIPKQSTLHKIQNTEYNTKHVINRLENVRGADVTQQCENSKYKFFFQNCKNSTTWKQNDNSRATELGTQQQYHHTLVHISIYTRVWTQDSKMRRKYT